MTLCAAGCGQQVRGAGEPLCELCTRLLAGMCLGKKRHWRERNAELARAATGSASSYRCAVCGLWHVGGVLVPGLGEKRAAVIEGLRRAGAGWVLTKLAGSWEQASRTEFKKAWSTRHGGAS